MTEAMLESLPVEEVEIHFPAMMLERPSSLDTEIDLADLMQDSISFYHSGRRRRNRYNSNKENGKSSLADSDSDDTVTTFANSSTASAFLSASQVELLRRESEVSALLLGKKRVRFDRRDEFGNKPYCEVFESDIVITEEEKLAMWWQPTEFRLFRRYCKRSADIARSSNDYADKFARVYDSCASRSSSKCNIFADEVTEFADVSRVSVRGLEAVVFPALVQARKLVVQGVVMTQERLDPNLSLDERAKVLSSTSRCLSGRARVLSRVLGAGDEEVAKDCHYSIDQKTMASI